MNTVFQGALPQVSGQRSPNSLPPPQKCTDNQLEMTTKRTIMENEQMSVELAYQSRQTEKLLKKNNVLIEENRSACILVLLIKPSIQQHLINQ